MKGRGREGVGSVAVETERRRREAPCRRCVDAVGGSLPYFYPCTRSFFFLLPWVARHFATSKKKSVLGSAGRSEGRCLARRPDAHRDQACCKSILNCGGEKKTPVCCHAQVSRTVVVVAVGKRASVRQRQQEAGGFSTFRARLSVRSCESAEAPPPPSYLRELQPCLKRRDTI